MPRHTFPKGHKFAKGGKREGAGPLTKDEQLERLTFIQWLEKEREERGERLAKKYYDMAEGDPATMRHLVDGEKPRARQQLDITGGIKIIKVDNFNPDDDSK